jgi:hypothetical protein
MAFTRRIFIKAMRSRDERAPSYFRMFRSLSSCFDYRGEQMEKKFLTPFGVVCFTIWYRWLENPP